MSKVDDRVRIGVREEVPKRDSRAASRSRLAGACLSHRERAGISLMEVIVPASEAVGRFRDAPSDDSGSSPLGRLRRSVFGVVSELLGRIASSNGWCLGLHTWFRARVRLLIPLAREGCIGLWRNIRLTLRTHVESHEQSVGSGPAPKLGIRPFLK